MADNASLHAAKANKDDEFYTQLKDISDELVYYREHFRDKVVFLNCDDPAESNFWKWFSMRFTGLGLKKLIATHYAPGEHSYKIEMTSMDEPPVYTELEGDGDFRSPECVALLEESDIVVTNPPFSLFKEFLPLLIKYNKKFLILGDENKLTLAEIYPLILEGKVWLGFHAGNMWFRVPDDTPPLDNNNRYKEVDGIKYRSLGNVVWYTNLDHERLHQFVVLYRRYDPDRYPRYENYNAIDVSPYTEMPLDYDGVMGVPITFMKYFSPDQFELIKFRKGDDGKDLCVDGTTPYFRMLIRNKHPEKS